LYDPSNSFASSGCPNLLDRRLEETQAMADDPYAVASADKDGDAGRTFTALERLFDACRRLSLAGARWRVALILERVGVSNAVGAQGVQDAQPGGRCLRRLVVPIFPKLGEDALPRRTDVAGSHFLEHLHDLPLSLPDVGDGHTDQTQTVVEQVDH